MIEFSLKASFERLQKNGLKPRTIFDIGVATGTKGLYTVFPDVRYVLVDPLEESEPFMQAICAKVPGAVYRLAAAGAAKGELDIGVHPGLSNSGRFLKKGYPRRTVPMVALADLVDELGLEGPFLVKIDVQGAELEVMKGLERCLDKVDAVVAEVSLWADRKLQGAPTIAEMIAWFDARGMVVYDIAGMAYRGSDGAIAEMDLVFLRRDSQLRDVPSYFTPEQIAERIITKRKKFDAPENVKF